MWKLLFNSLRKLLRDLKNEIITLISYLKQDNVAPTQKFKLFEVDLKFPLLCLLNF